MFADSGSPGHAPRGSTCGNGDGGYVEDGPVPVPHVHSTVQGGHRIPMDSAGGYDSLLTQVPVGGGGHDSLLPRETADVGSGGGGYVAPVGASAAGGSDA